MSIEEHVQKLEKQLLEEQAHAARLEQLAFDYKQDVGRALDEAIRSAAEDLLRGIDELRQKYGPQIERAIENFDLDFAEGSSYFGCTTLQKIEDDFGL